MDKRKHILNIYRRIKKAFDSSETFSEYEDKCRDIYIHECDFPYEVFLKLKMSVM